MEDWKGSGSEECEQWLQLYRGSTWAFFRAPMWEFAQELTRRSSCLLSRLDRYFKHSVEPLAEDLVSSLNLIERHCVCEQRREIDSTGSDNFH